MLTGLCANALGWAHTHYSQLESLQSRIRFGARIDRVGSALVDYQTADLGKEWMLPENTGWTTRGSIDVRGGASGDLTHQRFRHYRADSLYTVAVALRDSDMEPTIETIAEALQRPARPLFIGRKCCIPSSPIFLKITEAASLLAALAELPRASRSDSGPLPATWWDSSDCECSEGESRIIAVTDERSWRDQVHVGRRFMYTGFIQPAS